MAQDRAVYSELDKSRWTYSPNLTRWRHRYRGVRESLKVNQEIGQTLYDVFSLRKKTDDLIESLNEIMEEQYLGKSDYVDVDYYYDSIDDSPVEYLTSGLLNLAERLSEMDRILTRLENNND